MSDLKSVIASYNKKLADKLKIYDFEHRIEQILIDLNELDCSINQFSIAFIDVDPITDLYLNFSRSNRHWYVYGTNDKSHNAESLAIYLTKFGITSDQFLEEIIRFFTDN